MIEHASGAPIDELATQPPPGTVIDHDPQRFLVLESCRSTWMFDEADHRFTRIRKVSGAVAAADAWRPYDRLVTDTGSPAFVIFLDAGGSRVLRAIRHEPSCVHCGGEETTEISLDAIRKLIES